MKKLTLFLSLILFASFIQTDIPNTFKVTEKYFAYGNDFSVTASGSSFGVIEERTFNFTRTFEYFDNNHTLKAKATQKAFTWGVEIIIYDEHQKVIGYIKESLSESFFSHYTTYYILDANKNTLGKSKKLDWFGTDITIYDNGGNVIVEMTRPYIRMFTDEWTVSINKNYIDKRILVFIPAYKTSADNKRKKEED